MTLLDVSHLCAACRVPPARAALCSSPTMRCPGHGAGGMEFWQPLSQSQERRGSPDWGSKKEVPPKLVKAGDNN